MLTSLILFIVYTLLCMFLFNTLNDWCCKHFVAITSVLLCLINKCFLEIQMFFSFFHIYVSNIHQCVYIYSIHDDCWVSVCPSVWIFLYRLYLLLWSIIITCHKYSLCNMYTLQLMVRSSWESWPSVAVKPWKTLATK